MGLLYEILWEKSLEEVKKALEEGSKERCNALGVEAIKLTIKNWEELGYDPTKPLFVNVTEKAKHLNKKGKIKVFISILDSLLSSEDSLWYLKESYLGEDLLELEEVERDVSLTLEKLAQDLELEIPKDLLEKCSKKICDEYKRNLEMHIKLRKRKVNYIE